MTVIDINLRGLDVFAEHFKGYRDNYVLIGGSACALLLNNVVLDNFRTTKDLDLVLCVEALSMNFVKHFWRFIELGGYQIINQSSGKRQYYRFQKPNDLDYPVMLELLSDLPEVLDKRPSGTIIPMIIEEDMVSLSAILMDSELYAFIMSMRCEINGITIVDERCLIPLKVRAYLDLSLRQQQGEQVKSTDINKHHNDVLRLTQLLTNTPINDVPMMIRQDIRLFIDGLSVDDNLLRQLDIRNMSINDIKQLLIVTYQVNG